MKLIPRSLGLSELVLPVITGSAFGASESTASVPERPLSPVRCHAPQGTSTLEGSENDLLLPPTGGQGDKASEPQSEAGFRTRSLEESGGRRLGWSICCLLSTSHPSSQVILKQPCVVGIVIPILPHFLNEKTDILESGRRFLRFRSRSLGTTRTGMPSAPFSGLSKKKEAEKEEKRGEGGETAAPAQDLALPAPGPPWPSHCLDHFEGLLTGVSASSLFPGPSVLSTAARVK